MSYFTRNGNFLNEDSIQTFQLVCPKDLSLNIQINSSYFVELYKTIAASPISSFILYVLNEHLGY